MKFCLFLAIFLALSISPLVLGLYEIVDESLSRDPDGDYIETNTLPGGVDQTDKDDLQMTVYNARELPELSSGIIGTTVYNESMFMAGLYRSSSTIRVRIPNYAMFRINRTDEEEMVKMRRVFYFNFTKGIWEEQIDTPKYFIRSIMGVHAHYSRTFFHAVKVYKKDVGTTLSHRVFKLSTHHGNAVGDEHFEQGLETKNNPARRLDTSDGADGFERKLRIKSPADQSDSEIVIFSNGPQAGTSDLISTMQFTFPKNQHVSESMYLQTVAPSKDRQSALEEYKTVQQSVSNIMDFLNLHTSAWDERFKDGDIELEGSGENYAKLRRLTKMSLYQVYSQFPFARRYDQGSSSSSSTAEDAHFHGVSACGLGRGGNSTANANADFGGHVTPDQETYLFLPIAILNPDLARQILFYRSRSLQSNRPPVPFESARSGQSVPATWCTHCSQQAQYPTGMLGLAVRQFFAITKDTNWVDLSQRGGLDIMEKIGRYFDQKIQKNATRSDYYSIIGVAGPDELHQGQTNNLLTNALAAMSIHYWKYLRCLRSKPGDDAVDKTLDKAKHLAMAFDSGRKTHEEFEGYDGLPASQQAITQADTMLAYFPVAWNMSKGHFLEQSNTQALYNDIQKFHRDFESTNPEHRDSGAPATAVAIKTIAHLQVGTTNELSNGRVNFEALWKTYAASPFFVWRNLTDRGDASAAGHIGTAAAFLDTLIFGFGGLRVQANRLDILRPSLPNGVTAINFKGLHFNGGEFDYSLSSDRIRINGRSAFANSMSLYDRSRNRYESFSGSADKAIPTQSTSFLEDTSSAALFSIMSIDSTNCGIDDRNHARYDPYLSMSGASGTAPWLSLLSMAALLSAAIAQWLL